VSLKIKICGTGQPTLRSQEICPPLSDELIKLGFIIEDDAHKSDFLISLNHDQNVYSSFRKFGGKIEKAVLIRLEPAAVFPAQHRPRIENLYGHIITPGNPVTTPPVPWPYYFNQNPLHPEIRTPSLEQVISEAVKQNVFEFEQWKQRPIRFSIIASNKVSPISKNNYKLRRQLAQSLPSELLTIYGGLWNSNLPSRIKHRAQVLNFALHSRIFPNIFEIYGNLFRRYHSVIGTIRDKHEIIRKSQFSLVIENDNNYVSEKLIDALVGGSIPIYFGGEYQRLGIPSGLAIKNLNSVTEIVDYLENVSQQEILDFQHKLLGWLQTPSFHQYWAGDNVFATIAVEISEYFRKVVP
jgi:hypothetical protein